MHEKSLFFITALTICVIVGYDYNRRRNKQQQQQQNENTHTTVRTRHLPSKQKQSPIEKEETKNNKEEKGKRVNESDNNNYEEEQEDEKEINAIETWLSGSFQTLQDTSDDFINTIFSTIPDWTVNTQDLPSLEELTERMTNLYPTFASQMESMRQTYEQFWNFLSMDEFRSIVEESQREDSDASLHPEIMLDAEVRIGSELSKEEQKFRTRRQKWQHEAFAKFIGVDPKEVDLRDIPVIGIASSGGGYRALTSSTGYLKAMDETGLLDCTTYIAGVSGSTWGMAQLYSRLTNRSFDTLVDHLKSHIHTHIANVSNFIAILQASAHNAKTLIQGLIQRYYQQNGTLNVVDIYGMLLGGTLLTEKQTIARHGGQKINKNDKKQQRERSKEEKEEEKEYSEEIEQNTEDRTVVGHEGLVRDEDESFIRPVLPSKAELKLSRQRKYFEDGSWPMPIYCVVHHELKDLYRWFEFTPYEMGCEELNAWIPIWSFGRQFKDGKNIERLPEQTLGTLMGVFGSAFASSLAHFFEEIRAFLPEAALAAVNDTLTQYKESLLTIHPFSPARFPNPFYKLDIPTTVNDSPSSPPTPEPSTHKPTLSDNDNDKGNENDNREEHEEEEEEEIKEDKKEKTNSLLDRDYLDLLDAGCDNNIPFYPLLRRERQVDMIIALDLSADIETAPHLERAQGYTKRRGIDGWPEEARWPDQKKKNEKKEYGLGTCTIFKGSQRTIAYFPLIVNDNYDPEFDPQTANFASTFNFVYTSAQTAKIVGLGEANWHDNVDQVKQALKSIWEEKKNQRMMSL